MVIKNLYCKFMLPEKIATVCINVKCACSIKLSLIFCVFEYCVEHAYPTVETTVCIVVFTAHEYIYHSMCIPTTKCLSCCTVSFGLIIELLLLSL